MIKQLQSHRLIFIAASFALASASCIADDADPLAATIPADGELTIVMNEFAFEPSSITVVAGSTVTVTLVNEGLTPHEFMVGRDSPEGGGYNDDLLGQMLMAADGHGFVRTTLAQDHVDDDDSDHDHPDDATTDDATTDDAADEHPADEHPADEHPVDGPDGHTSDHHSADEADEHPIDGHPADEHPADDPEGHTSDGHGDAEHGHQGSAITVEAGGEATLVFMIPADATGSWEVGCFIEGHYEAGMLGTLTVNPPAA